MFYENGDTTASRLDRIDSIISQQDFLENKGLSNEVGIHVFWYDPTDEMMVRSYINRIKNDDTKPYRIIEKDLYEIFLEICEEKRLLDKIPTLEKSKGKEFIKDQLQKIASAKEFAPKINYEDRQPGDILVITGVGKVYPFMRAHLILDNIQSLFIDMPVLMFYPGKYNGQNFMLFGKFDDGNYYRAFNLIGEEITI